MDNRIYWINLYDIYGELLTEKQKNYFEDYYFSNLSLAEIAQNGNISRNAVYNQLKYVLEKMSFYENTIHLYERNEKIKKLISHLDDDIKIKIEDLL